VLVRKPLKTAWLNVAMRPQRFDGSTYDAAVGSAARKRERTAVDYEAASDDGETDLLRCNRNLL
jgi:hypothetical protein